MRSRYIDRGRPDVGRTIEMHWTGRIPSGHGNCAIECFSSGCRRQRGRPFGDRRHERTMIQPLMRKHLGMAVREHEERRAIEERARDAIDSRRRTRPERRQTRARPAGHLGLRHSRKSAGGFGCRKDERQTCASGGGDDVKVSAAARNAEHRHDTCIA